MPELPMFPLGAVLLPTSGMPLHVFEPRYRAMVRDCLDGDRRFGVVLIERGHEVGGGDVRTDVGTVADIVGATESPDGRWALSVVGTHRIRVDRWLADDPYPRADVSDWPDPAPGPHHAAALDRALVWLRRVLALAAEAGLSTAPATVELAPDPVVAGYQAIALAPIGPHDRHRLLAAPSPEDRVALLAEVLTDTAELLRARLAGG